MSDVTVFPDLARLAEAVADHLVVLSQRAIEQRGRFSIGLSGGSTPKPLFRLLVSEPFATRIDWSKVHVFWGDERCVPPDHPDSNYGMAHELLLAHVPVPPGQVYRMRGEIEPSEAAAEYERVLRTFFESSPAVEVQPRFDVLLQGLGPDGHTASLFPHTVALRDTTHWVVPNYVDKLGVWRLTLTAAAINRAAQVTFMVAGEKKADALAEVLHGPYQPEAYPAQLIQPSDGVLRWMVDAAAASHLPAGAQ